MKAVVGRALGPLENYELESWYCPPPEPGEVQVDVYAAGVTFVDALIAMGGHQLQVPLPFIPGNEVSGVVREVGAGVTHVSPGDKVACVGVGGKYAQRINVPEVAALEMPDSMGFEEAAVFRGSFECSYHALVQGGQVRPGEKVLVLGAAGAIGQAAIQIAVALGARVLASASSAPKRELARRAGAEAAINTGADDWRAQVRDWAGPNGVDVVVDPVGGAATERAFRAMGLGGRHLVIGFASGTIPDLPVNLALLKGACLVGIELSKFERRFPELAASNRSALLNLYMRGAITTPRIAHRFALSQFREALALAASGASAGSIVMDLQES